MASFSLCSYYGTAVMCGNAQYWLWFDAIRCELMFSCGALSEKAQVCFPGALGSVASTLILNGLLTRVLLERSPAAKYEPSYKNRAVWNPLAELIYLEENQLIVTMRVSWADLEGNVLDLYEVIAFQFKIYSLCWLADLSSDASSLPESLSVYSVTCRNPWPHLSICSLCSAFLFPRKLKANHRLASWFHLPE